MTQSIAERAARSLRLLTTILKISRGLRSKIQTLQIEHGFDKQRVVRIHILDADKQYTMVLRKNGKLKLFTKFPPTPDVEIVFERLCTLKHLRLGYRCGIHPGTDEVLKIVYSPLVAWKMGDVRTFGAASTNDAMTFFQLFKEIVSLIPEADIVKLCGPCEHDLE